MNTKGRLEDIVRKDLEVRASDKAYGRMHRIVLNAHGTTERTKIPTFARRLLMDRPVVKLAIAAAVVAAVVLGLFEFLTPGGPSGVVWADVAQKVDNSRGVAYRMQETSSDSSGEAAYAMVYSSPTRERADYCKGGQTIRTIYADYDTKTVVYVLHEAKRYIRDTHSLGEFGVQEHRSWVNPRGLVQKFLSCKHRKLEPKTVEGIQCEGLETTDPAFFGSQFPVPISSLDVQLWVSIQTGYPVLFRGKVLCGRDGKRRIEGTADQFQWDVEIDPSGLEPQMPPGYTLEEWPS